jgi:Flp pilus assembly protein TadD
MSIKHTLALSAIAAALALLQGCASTPKQPEQPAGSTAESNEPDLVDQLRERMAAGTLQRQEKAEDKKPSAAAEDTSRSPVITVDTGKQQAAMAVAADYAKAIGLMASNQDAKALLLLQAIAQKTPSFSGPLINQAVILLRQKQYAEAEKQLLAALAINARNPFAYNLLGIALREQGKFADARAAYESALSVDPNYAKAHFNLGILADLYQQDLPFALSHYERYQVLQSKPDPAVANWIVDLQKRTGVYKAPPPPVAAPAEAPVTEASGAEENAKESAEAPVPAKDEDASAPENTATATPAKESPDPAKDEPLK